MTKKNLTSIFLNKNWIINETPKAIAIIAPKYYFTTKKDNLKYAIWFSKAAVFNSIKYQNRMIIWIDFEHEYQIITTDNTNTEVNKEIILGKDLYQELKITINEVKNSYLNKKNLINK